MNPVSLLRLAIPILFLTHGLYRIFTGIVDDFGVFFSGLGWPYGLQLAWLVTVLEITTSLLIIFGIKIQISAWYLFIQTFLGVILVHWSSGWFVVGGGRNGMEYSVLLMICLIIIIIDRRTSQLKLT